LDGAAPKLQDEHDDIFWDLGAFRKLFLVRHDKNYENMHMQPRTKGWMWGPQLHLRQIITPTCNLIVLNITHFINRVANQKSGIFSC
jgi:hypothetical protein